MEENQLIHQTQIKKYLRHVGAGRLWYHFYHRPLGMFRNSLNEGGPWEQWKTLQGRLAMEKAAHTLPIPEDSVGPTLEVHLLTGRRFWYQSAFCLWSLATCSKRRLSPFVYDDGSLTEDFQTALSRIFPEIRFISNSESQKKLDTFLPSNRFPFLRDRWCHYPNIRKLIDPHLGSNGWKLVVDSDILFFRKPSLILNWLDNPRNPLHAIDCATSYGYSRPLLDTLAGSPLSELVNVGLCGLNSREINWEHLEFWCRELVTKEGTHYYLEQALVAMLLAGRVRTIAPAIDYLTLPLPPEVSSCNAVMHHYVANSKRWYFRQNWKKALTLSPTTLEEV